ncbi:hypothetical protein [Alloyangia pacifica]|uniref:hypothetical protein n=1 Tax=Alloyangia pacifica TaxID=311180 RepID=UPI0031E49617
MRYLFLFGLPVMLFACTEAETEALIEDPSAFSCRERAVATMSVGFEETVARPLNTDIFGTQNYEVGAAGQRFRCTLDTDGDIISFRRI